MLGIPRRWTTTRRFRVGTGLLLAGAFCIQCQQLVSDAPNRTTATSVPHSNVAYAAVRTPEPTGDPHVSQLQRDPLAFLRECLARYDRSVRDYECTFTKRELVGGALSAEQVTHVQFRQHPYSVDMTWVKNADKAHRALYVEGKWTGTNGERLAVVEPAGAIARLLVDTVKRPIDGPDARKAARRRIDEFGFRNTLQLILKYCDIAGPRGELGLKFVGESAVAGRPTYVIERHLPYTDEGGPYPDRVLVVHIDKEYLLPTSCTSYADDARTQLLGQYVLTDLRFNAGLTDADFEP